MASIAVNVSQVGAVFPRHARIRDHIAGEMITVGQSVYTDATGKSGLCSANTTGKQQFRGIALTPAGPGQATSVLEQGEVYGFDLSGVAYDGLVYQADTAGGLDSAASSTKTVPVGRVTALSDSARTKVLFVQSAVTSNW